VEAQAEAPDRATSSCRFLEPPLPASSACLLCLPPLPASSACSFVTHVASKFLLDHLVCSMIIYVVLERAT
jgi:hypothetical protein